MQRVLIAGGGTGGHLYPGIAVAREIRKHHANVEISFVGTMRGLEARIVPREGFQLIALPVRGLPRRFGRAQVGAVFAMVRSLAIMWRHFLKWRPDVILGTGGYASAPPVLVGWFMRIPIVLQEQNAIPGIVNRWLSRVADEVHINFAAARRHFKRRDHLRLTGNPLRAGLLRGNRQRAYKRFNLAPSRQTIFVLGGSHGAHAINAAFVDAIARMPANLGAQWLVQTGKEDAAWVRRQVEGKPVVASVHAFIHNIEEAYTVADLIVCRAGAMTLSEVVASGIPAIVVPYPHAADNHQERNAEELVERGAAVMVRDSELTGDRLMREVQGLLGDRQRLRRMAALGHGIARFDGAARIASAMAVLAGRRKE
jgi:UDP-N-acetylglucosamine--N-acetylmuramyl-(pentapeptide) pyrophosphoryl-undecaprenol N-acetylglucosamine transferase